VSIEIRPMREDERERVFELREQAFNVPVSKQRKSSPVPLENSRVATLDGEVVATLVVYPFAHFFGGRSVPALGIGGVAVAAHARGKRVAETLMTETIREYRDAGSAISTLYPATVPLYRRCGYEFASFRFHYRASLEVLPRAGSAASVEPWDDPSLAEIADCYRQYASAMNGPVDRPDWFWPKRVLHVSDDNPVRRYCVREDGRVTGYAVYTHEKAGSLAYGFNVDCRDLVWTTPASGAALLGFFARHRSTGVDLMWAGPAGDAMSNLLSEQEVNHESWFRQMLRLVDVPAAFEARGYPAPLEAAVELQVEDPALGWNDAGWRIETSGGTAKVSPAPSARPTVDVRTLAAVFSGFLTARDARRLGKLDADDETVATLDAMLAGPTPWINDWY
jgi:predicted acetyltransferase